jgi:hypothetical protein
MMVWFGSVAKEWMAVVILGSSNSPVMSLKDGCYTWTRPRMLLLSLSHTHAGSVFAIVAWKSRRRMGVGVMASLAGPSWCKRRAGNVSQKA